jgi:hypothetical protein
MKTVVKGVFTVFFTLNHHRYCLNIPAGLTFAEGMTGYQAVVD